MVFVTQCLDNITSQNRLCKHLKETGVGNDGFPRKDNVAFFVKVIEVAPTQSKTGSLLHAWHLGLETRSHSTADAIAIAILVTHDPFRLDFIDAVHVLIETVIRQFEAHLGDEHDANGETYPQR